jgi:TctA family transporter
MRRVRTYGRLLRRRISPARIWQTVLAGIILAGIYGCLPGTETEIARAWMEKFLERFR